MLVDNERRNVLKVELVARAGHGHGEIDGFLAIHSAKVNGHEPGCNLIVWDHALCESLDKKVDFLGIERHAVSLPRDDVNGSHVTLLSIV